MLLFLSCSNACRLSRRQALKQHATMPGLLQVKDADQPQHQLHRQQTAGPSYCVVLQFFEHAANVYMLFSILCACSGPQASAKILARHAAATSMPSTPPHLAKHHFFLSLQKQHFFLRSCGQESTHGCTVQSVVQRVHTYSSIW